MGVRMPRADDFNWMNTHYAELQKKYPSMYVAIRDGKVLAADKEFDEAYNKARKKVGKGFITGYVFSGEPFVLKTNI